MIDAMDNAFDALNIAHQKVGGRFIKVDCENSEGLKRFYRENGFTEVQENPLTGMVEMAMFYREDGIPPVGG